MSQKTLVLLKPDAVKRNLIGEIIKRFEDGGLKVEALEMLQADEKIVAEHYQLNNRDYILTLGHTDITGKTEAELDQIYQKHFGIVENLQKALMSGPIIKILLSGSEDVVQKVRDIVGKTDPGSSPKGSIRGDLGEDSFAEADKEKRAVWNLVHASGTQEEAEREIELWFGKKS